MERNLRNPRERVSVGGDGDSGSDQEDGESSSSYSFHCDDEDDESAGRAVEPEVIVIDEDDCFGGKGGVLIDVTN